MIPIDRVNIIFPKRVGPAITYMEPRDEYFFRLVPSWHQKGANLPELDWPINQPLTADEIKKVPSWSEKGTNLLHKKIIYLISILAKTSQPVKLDKIMKWMDYANCKTFRDNYLEPLQQVQFIRKTNPDNPTDPEQKYVITEKGKLFFAGRDIA